ncbi:MAG: tetratricopeptide repeat protein [Isosphaeraceae bacterium]
MPTPDELYEAAITLRDQGDKPAAAAKLEEAVAIDPGFTLGHGMLAKLYADLARADDAIAHALKVVEHEPKDVFSYTALSVIYQRCGRIREAEDAKAKAFAIQNGWED